jgi:hypothetical protein
MRKLFCFSIILAVTIFSLSLKEVNASLVTVDKAGDTIVNVLSEEDTSGANNQAGSIEVVGGASEVKYSDAKIALTKDKGKLSLSILSSSGGKDFDITNYKDSVLEIEERPAVEKFTISVNSGTFLITQGDINAETDYQIQVDPKKGDLALETPSGYKFLLILPKQAASVLLRAKLATTITSDDKAYILEDEKGNLYYDMTAKKIIPIFNIYNYEFGVRAKVSATSGEIISIDEPTWYRFFNFLFV